MPSLKEFLQKQAEEQRTESARREAVRADWVGAVNRLLDRMVQWIRANDPENILRIDKTEHRIREKDLGEYPVCGLRVSLPTREIRIEPVARYSIGSFVGDRFGASIRNGRVDMTNGDTRYQLYRKSEGTDDWVLVNDRDYRAAELDPSTFEAAVLSLLQ